MAQPPVLTGQVGSWNRLVGVKLDIDDAIKILDPTDVPLQGWAGSAPTQSIKVEWLEEDLTPQSVHVPASGSNVTGTGPWTVTVDDANVVRVNDVLIKDVVQQTATSAAVQFVVTATDFNQTITLAGFAGNTTGPVNSDTLTIIGQVANEGGAPQSARTVDRRTNYNYTQIGQEKVEATRTERKRAMYGQEDPYTHELQKKFKELAIRFERSMVLGKRYVSGDAKSRQMGGLLYYISTNAVSDVQANSKTAILSLFRKAYEAGGTPKVLMVSPAMKQALSANIDPSMRRTDRVDTTGGFLVDKLATDFGEVDFVVNRFFPKQTALLLQQEFIIRRVFDGYTHETLAKVGDGDQGEIVGEFSLEVKNEKAHGILQLTDVV